MRVYLAGAMRGKPHFNREAFALWADKLRADGHEVFSPAESSEKTYGPRIYWDNPEGDEPKAGIDGRKVFEDDLVWICRHADAVALMPGWRESRGATAEHAVAVALDLEVIEL